MVWFVRKEMARTVDDVLSRRTRSIVLDARAAVEAAPAVAEAMATELGYDADWMDQEVNVFGEIASGYILK